MNGTLGSFCHTDERNFINCVSFAYAVIVSERVYYSFSKVKGFIANSNTESRILVPPDAAFSCAESRCSTTVVTSHLAYMLS